MLCFLQLVLSSASFGIMCKPRLASRKQLHLLFTRRRWPTYCIGIHSLNIELHFEHNRLPHKCISS